MAKSPSHQFGQIIGDVLEISIESLLENFVREHNLYLDKKGSRLARKGKKVSWIDLYGNQHDLDFVLENGGSDTQIGTPVAFIETAWRRYTKHSRNKAQEIQGAILPLVATHQNAAPFIGVILAGCFTENSLNQLNSLGFTIAYFPYNTIIQAFEFVGINAYFNEKTPDAEFAEKVSSCQTLSKENYTNIANKLVELNSDVVAKFINQLRHYVTRKITSIKVLPLHGNMFEYNSIKDAIEFIERYQGDSGLQPLVKYEIQVNYNTGDRIEGQFIDKQNAIKFLRTYQLPDLRPMID